MKVKLTGVPETMVLPLWFKAVETDHPEPIIQDPKAKEIVSQLDYDFDKFNNAWISQVGISIRTMLLDNAAATIINQSGSVLSGPKRSASGVPEEVSRLRVETGATGCSKTPLLVWPAGFSQPV